MLSSGDYNVFAFSTIKLHNFIIRPYTEVVNIHFVTDGSQLLSKYVNKINVEIKQECESSGTISVTQEYLRGVPFISYIY